MNILEIIAKRTKERIEERKKALPHEKLVELASQMNLGSDYPFEKALQSDDISFICEIKKASPSKGVITDDFRYLEIAKDYEAAGASAISVLTEPYYFMGSNRHLQEIAQTVKLPLLRKDFTVDSYMIHEAKTLGACAILLICAIMHQETLEEYIGIAHSIGLSCLVEAHDENEVKLALAAGARIIGVNNRNLKTFDIDTSNSVRLRKLLPPGIIFVSESGVKTAEDIDVYRKNNIDAVLIGETLMRAQNKKDKLDELRKPVIINN